MAATANTFKFSTFLWLLAGAVIPFWIVTLPLCWFMAYRSYKSGTTLADQIVTAQQRSVSYEPVRPAQPPIQQVSAPQAASNASSAASYDEEKWRILCEVDPDIKTANDSVAVHGSAAVAELARKYLTLNDKSYLQPIATSIISAAEKAAEAKSAEAEQLRLAAENAKYEGDFWGVKWRKSDDGPIFADLGDGQQSFDSQDAFEKAVKDAWRVKNAGGRA